MNLEADHLADQANIVYLLLSHLNRHLWFEIPGIGVFNASKSATFIDHIAKQIHPARLHIEFVSANTLRTETMIQNMVSETGYEQELLEEHLAALCQTIDESIKANGHYDFIPFGTLSSYSGNLFFNQSNKNIHQEFYSMEPLAIVPAEVPRDHLIVPVEIIPIKKTKSKRELLYLLLALAILWFVFLGLLFCPPKSRKNDSKDTIIPADTSTIIKDTPVIAIDTMPVADTIIQDTIPQHEADSIGSVQDSTDKLNNEVIIDSTNIDSLSEKIKYKPCIIVIGSFAKKSNADRLSKNVEKNGYEAYRGRYKEYYRVGVKFNCFEKDLQQMLKELKGKFNPDSWVLKF